MSRVVRLGRNGMVQYFIATASWAFLARINASFGSAAVAGYSLAIRIVLFALMPSWGICSAAATLVWQNLGAKRPDRAERAAWLAGTYNMAFLTVVAVVFYAGAPMLVGLFRPEAAAGSLTLACLRVGS